MVLSTLFASPKRGGVLQSSGFLVLKRWLERDGSTAASMIHIKDMLFEALRYEVMLEKMLRTLPEPERFKFVNEQNRYGWTVLQGAALWGNIASFETILALYPEPQRKQALCTHVEEQRTLLHCVTNRGDSGDSEFIHKILALYPESERLQVARICNIEGRTALHHVAESGDIECVRSILSLYPESDRLQAICAQDQYGWTVLHYAMNSRSIECIELLLALHSASEYVQVLNMVNIKGDTALHRAARSGHYECVRAILSLYPETQRLEAVKATNRFGVDVWDYATESDNPDECLKVIRALCPESECLTESVEANDTYATFSSEECEPLDWDV